jgi:predicted AlkP superfamily pyrophosphatase or phosphodiesterase
MHRLTRFLAVVLVCVTACRASADPTDQRVVLVSLDGFRWDYLDRPEAANLRAIARLGVRAVRMEPVFPTKTFPNHYTLVTGLYPENHGIISNTMEDPQLGRFTLGDTLAVRNGAWWGGEPIWVTAQVHGKRAAAFFWPGSEAGIKGVLPWQYMHYRDDVPHDVRVRRVLQWLALPPDSAPRVITLYFSAVDAAGHRFGPDAIQTRAAIARVDSAVGALWRGIGDLGLRRRVHLILVSDHGMVETDPERVIVLDDWLEPGSYRVVDWNPVAFVVPAVGREDAVYQRLRQIPHLRVYRKGELPAHYHLQWHPRLTPIVAEAEEGWSIASRAMVDSNPRFGVGGNHGYDPALESMGALFVGVGPRLARGKVVPRVRAVDLYALMAHLIGVPPAPNNGTLDSIAMVLKDHP